eukprot:TRINITY_DN9746_c0_g1_i1.p1 TRINITY_DN9746_c0_g1~~TRINITY_DN9746_c0_g1_i1.p1  ORF type:complete len:430 (-),score=120.48 TRINITY_DN9746_c0_g1_i1:455-1744(-)
MSSEDWFVVEDPNRGVVFLARLDAAGALRLPKDTLAFVALAWDAVGDAAAVGQLLVEASESVGTVPRAVHFEHEALVADVAVELGAYRPRAERRAVFELGPFNANPGRAFKTRITLLHDSQPSSVPVCTLASGPLRGLQLRAASASPAAAEPERPVEHRTFPSQLASRSEPDSKPRLRPAVPEEPKPSLCGTLLAVSVLLVGALVVLVPSLETGPQAVRQPPDRLTAHRILDAALQQLREDLAAPLADQPAAMHRLLNAFDSYRSDQPTSLHLAGDADTARRVVDAIERFLQRFDGPGTAVLLGGSSARSSTPLDVVVRELLVAQRQLFVIDAASGTPSHFEFLTSALDDSHPVASADLSTGGSVFVVVSDSTDLRTDLASIGEDLDDRADGAVKRHMKTLRWSDRVLQRIRHVVPFVQPSRAGCRSLR